MSKNDEELIIRAHGIGFFIVLMMISIIILFGIISIIGIFITNEGKKINADINGSLNILRKYIKNSNPNLEIAMDNGREQRPIKKRVA